MFKRPIIVGEREDGNTYTIRANFKSWQIVVWMPVWLILSAIFLNWVLVVIAFLPIIVLLLVSVSALVIMLSTYLSGGTVKFSNNTKTKVFRRRR